MISGKPAICPNVIEYCDDDMTHNNKQICKFTVVKINSCQMDRHSRIHRAAAAIPAAERLHRVAEDTVTVDQSED